MRGVGQVGGWCCTIVVESVAVNAAGEEPAMMPNRHEAEAPAPSDAERPNGRRIVDPPLAYASRGAIDSGFPFASWSQGMSRVLVLGCLLAVVPAEDARSQETITAVRSHSYLMKQVVLAADRPGLIANDLPREGDTVTANDEIVSLKDELARAAFEVAVARAENRATIDAAEREFDVSVTELELAEEANSRVADAVPGVEVERLRFTRDLNAFRITNSKSEYRITGLERDQRRAELDTYGIDTPIGGTVVKVHKTRGEAVQQGEPILEIADTSVMKVEGYVTVAEALRLKRGDEVTVQPVVPGLNLPAEEITTTGKLIYVDVKVSNPVKPLVRVWAEVENPRGLLFDGQQATMSITPSPAAPVASLR